MPKLTVAATQMACSWDLPANIDRAENLIRQAASRCANVMLIQEFDMDIIRQYRESWGIYRDRDSDLYRAIPTLDGNP